MKASELLKQLDRKQCALTLQKPGKDKLNSAQIAERKRKGVLVVSTNASIARSGTAAPPAVYAHRGRRLLHQLSRD